MEDEPGTYQRVADMMSRMWVYFVTRLDPNYSGGKRFLEKTEKSLLYDERADGCYSFTAYLALILVKPSENHHL